MSFINFQSLSEINKNKELEREEREKILKDVKRKYERNLQREKEAKIRGEDTWMLPSVEEKVDPKKIKKKEKKKKKKKKVKSKKKKKDVTSSSSSSESEEENEQNMWVEKKAEPGPIKRDEWMEVPSVFRTQTREQMKIADGSSRVLKRLEERKLKEEKNKPGSHSRELNPYYKDGGIGLPSSKPSLSTTETSKVPSYDASWLRKALQRAKDKAAEEGRSLESVAQERWGSLEAFYKLLNEAEGNKDVKDKKKLQENSRERINYSRDRNRMENERDSDRSYRNRMEKERGSDRSFRNRVEKESDSDGSYRNRVEKERDSDGSYRNRVEKERDSDRRRRSRSRDSRRKKTKDKYSRNSSSSESEGRRNRKVKKEKKRRSRSSSSRERSRSAERDRSRRRRSSSVESKKTKNTNERRKRRHSSSSSSSTESSENDINSKDRSKNGADRETKPKSVSSVKGNTKLTMLKPASDEDDSTSVSGRSREFLKPTETSSFSNTRTFPSKYGGNWRKKSQTQVPTDTAKTNSSSSSSESSDTEEESEKTPEKEEVKKEEEVPILNDKEMNQLAAKLMKAELLGNAALVEKLKSKLEASRKARENKTNDQASVQPSVEEEEQVVVLTRTDKSGFTRPVVGSAEEEQQNKRKKKKGHNPYDAEGKRTSYFADDFSVDLHDMFEREKTTSAADQIADLEKMSCYNTEKLTDDFDVDDMFMTKVAPKESGMREKEREKRRAIHEHKRMEKALESCNFCMDNKLMKKHLIIALGKKCFLCLPSHQSLTEGHCLIVPIQHVPCATRADEDLWEEIMGFRQALVRMFSAAEEDCIFFESALRLEYLPHMVIQCVSLPKETGELAPIYFKKAILECDEEWAQNKKLIDLKGRNVRKAVPKGLPYFSVDFGMSPGFAHVVENERLFPNNFAQEIIGGMIDADFSLYRKPRSENFDIQRKKVLKFAEMFKPFDPTL